MASSINSFEVAERFKRLTLLEIPKLSVCLVVSFLLVVAIKRRYFSAISKYPGPFVASFSSLWQMRHAFKGSFSKDVFALHMRHGDFVRISHKEVSLTHPDAIKSILQAPLDKSDWYKIWALPDSTVPSVQSTVNAKDVSRRQRNIGNAYTLSSLLRSEPQIDDVIHKMKQCFNKVADTGKAVNLGEWWAWAAFDVVGELTFSSRFGFLEAGKDISGAVASTELMMIYGVTMGYALKLNTLLVDNALVRNINRWLNLTDQMHLSKIAMGALADREKNPEARPDMVSQWFDNLAKSRDIMSPDEIKAAATGNVGGGSETVSATLQSTIYHLLKTPHTLRLVQAELDAAPLSEIPLHSEVAKLPYLQACVKEALRMHPAGPWNLPRVVPTSGLTLGGEYFPPGTVLSVNPWVVHHHPSLFKRPESFEPERWLVDDEQRKREESFWIPFGAGYNRCPGRQLALMEVPKMAALMLRDFEFERVEPGKEWEWRNNFTAVPHGWDCYVTRRMRGGRKTVV